MKKSIELIFIVVLLSFAANSTGTYVTDDFSIPHNYLTEGTTGTIWDAFIGLNAGESVDVLDASVTQAGELYMASTGAVWAEVWNPLGPFLYRMADGDFTAIVKITGYQNVLHNNCGIMARAPKTPVDLGGPGEDWLSLDYFPIWGCGNFVRSANDDVRTENWHNGLQWNLYPYHKLERIGNTFYFYISTDGISWTPMSGCPSLTRPDLDGVPMQVGLFQATYSGDQGYVAFDNFSLNGASGLGRIVIEQTDGKTEVYESGNPAFDTYTVALEGEAPVSNVTVNISHDDQIEVSPASLVFNSSNHTIPRTITVTAVDNIFPDGKRTSLVTNSAVTSDPTYQDKSEEVTVTIFDDDRLSDLVKDGFIDAADLKFICDRWLDDCGLDTFCDGADLTGILGNTPNPGSVDNKDIAVFAGHWYEGPLLISEFMASNTAYFETQVNGYEASPDWIEIYCACPSPINLQGWYLTDDPNNLVKWPFPPVTLNPGNYTVVFASGQDVNDFVDDFGYLHTNFNLDADGGYLAIVAPDGQTISHQYIQYPGQKTNYSYGINGERQGYFAVATPGEQNGEVYSGFVADTQFDTDRGFYDQPFDVEISTNTPGATIRYTFNGTDPTMTNGFTYTGPIPITNTTCLRAAAFKNDLIPTNIDTQTYIYINNTINQSSSAPTPDWPAPGWYNGQIFDYEMDPDVTTNPVYSELMDDALLQIPSISLVTDINNLIAGTYGIYVHACNKGEDWERPVSVELINPDGSEGFHINAGLRMRGQASCGGGNPKHAFRLFFRAKYGDSKLRFRLFGDEGGNSFDKVDLRCEQNYSWSKDGDDWSGGQNTLIKDVFARDLQKEMGQPYNRSRYYHLYINGAYWGVYQTEERADAKYGVTNFGGDTYDYDAVKTNSAWPRKIEVTDGTIDSYQRLHDAAVAGFGTDTAYYKIQGLNTNGTPNPAYERLCDVDNVIVYLLSTYYIGDIDGPVTQWYGNGCANNLFAIYNKRNPDGYKFFKHDAEHSCQSHLLDDFPSDPYGVFSGAMDRTGPWDTGQYLEDFNPQWLHQQLMAHPEYKLRFADIAHKHLFNNGILTPGGAQELFMSRAAQIDLAIIAESARWGDAQWHPVRTKNDDWLVVLSKLQNEFFPVRTQQIIDQLKNKGLYPNVTAPTFYINGSYQHGGQITPPASLTMSAPAGTIYYTLNGSDPRQPLTGTAVGTQYGGAITLNQTTIVKARVRSSGVWSALNEAVYDTGLVKNNLRITEIMYHPQETGDPNDPNEEFIEIRNIGAETINLNMVSFTEGIHFTFANMTLAPGEYAVLTCDQDAFEYKYPGISLAGVYTGKLDNAGERIRLQDATGQTVLDFEYKDGWCENTDGEGYSLTINDETNPDPNSWAWEKFWSASTYIDGTPGAGDTGPRWGDIVINEVLAHQDSYPQDWIELHNTTDHSIDISGWFLSDSDANLTTLTKYQITSATIPANGYIVFTESNHFGSYFALSENGDTVYLTSGYDNDSNLTGYRQKEDFDASENGVAFGRHLKSTGTYNFVAMSENTPGPFFEGAENAYPKVGPVVITEIMYNPPGNFDAEYIELYNVTAGTVNLFDGEGNGWKFTDGIDCNIPNGTTIPAHGFLVFVKDLTAFNSQYSVPGGVQVIQWTAGGLNNDSEKVEISMPGDIDEYGIRQYIRIDRVSYSDGSQHQDFYGIDDPWPVEADGLGYSLTKINYALYGNDPIAWTAYPPSPGQTPSAPQKATNPNPANGAPNQPTSLTLTWSNGGGALNYDVYFGTDSTPDSGEFKVNTTLTTYNPGTLLGSTIYYWRIDANNPLGTTTGDVWNFTTVQWTQLTFDNFEAGNFGNYTDGGDNCLLYYGTTHSHQGNYAVDIQSTGDPSASFYHTNGFDVHTPGYTQIKVDFWYKVVDLEPNEKFYVEYYNGSSWQIVATFTAGTDFPADATTSFYNPIIYINEGTYNFPTNMKIKFRCAASSATDDVYIDDITISAK